LEKEFSLGGRNYRGNRRPKEKKKRVKRRGKRVRGGGNLKRIPR